MSGATAQAETVEGLFDARFMWRVFFAILALLVVAGGISVAGRLAGHSIAMAGHTDDTSFAEVVIGNNVLSAPRNMIRFESARRGGVAERLDLYLRWPDLTGYTNAARDDFNHADNRRNILFVSVSEAMMSRDMSGRYEPIYSALTEPSIEAAPAGLKLRRFTEKSGYVNETLLVGDRAGNEPFVARCLEGDAAAQSLAPCERDIHIADDLSLSYRFPRELLGDWQKLDASMLRLAKWILKTAD
ncbi:MAG: hypothetical protein WBA44_06015 [Mesorhizobium sp.]